MPNFHQNRRVLLANPPRGASFVGPLDAYTTGLQVALLPFQGYSSYAGSWTRLRDAGNSDAEQNVTFGPTGEVVSPTLVGSGYGRKYYNQTGAADFGQSTAALQPLYSATGLGSEKAFIFDGAATYLSSESALTFSSGFSLYVAGQFGADGSWQHLFGISDGSLVSYLRKTADSGFKVAWFDDTASHLSSNSPGTSPFILSAILGGGNKKLWMNNTLEINVASSANMGSAAYLIGKAGWADALYMNGPVGAVLAFNAVHDDTTRQSIQTILADRFSITLT